MSTPYLGGHVLLKLQIHRVDNHVAIFKKSILTTFHHLKRPHNLKHLHTSHLEHTFASTTSSLTRTHLSNMKLLAFSTLCGLGSSFLLQPMAPTAPRANPLALDATRRGRDGKIYIGEPDPLTALGDVARRAAEGFGNAADGVMDRVLGKQPSLVPIPVPMSPETPEQIEGPSLDRHPGGDWGMGRF